jgi:hypothetical protein
MSSLLPSYRRTHLRSTLVIASLFVAQPMSAQSMGTMVVNDVKHAAADLWSVWTSPLRGHGRDWLIAGGVVAASAAISPLDDNVDRWAIRHANDNVYDAVNPFREGGDAFSGRTITPLAVGTLLVSVVTKSQPMQDGVFGCLSAYIANYGVRHAVMNPLVGRTRPDSSRDTPSPAARPGDQYEFDFPSDGSWGQRSFPGGHAANVTSCGSFLANRFDMGVFEVIPYAAIGSVTLARMLDRRHWLSDQVIGVATGWAIGKAVADRQLKRRRGAESGRTESAESNLLIDSGPNGMKVGFKSSF